MSLRGAAVVSTVNCDSAVDCKDSVVEGEDSVVELEESRDTTDGLYGKLHDITSFLCVQLVAENYNVDITVRFGGLVKC
jgi:hypothetical protein